MSFLVFFVMSLSVCEMFVWPHHTKYGFSFPRDLGKYYGAPFYKKDRQEKKNKTKGQWKEELSNTNKLFLLP